MREGGVMGSKERWKSVVGYEGLYEVSDHGVIDSLPRPIAHINRWGHNIRITNRKTLKPSVTGPGYQRVTLCKKGSMQTYSVHRLVMIAFKENPDNLPQINHIDGNKTNNALTNLEWCDQFHNQQHAYKTGLNIPKVGADHVGSLSVVHIMPNGKRFEYGSIGQASKTTGVNRSTISNCCHKNVNVKAGSRVGHKFIFNENTL